MREGLFFAGFLDFSLKQSAFQRTMTFQIGLVLCDLCVLLVCVHSVLCAALYSGFGSVLSVFGLRLELCMLLCSLSCWLML
jgi:hypothetical protein